jgi:nicotinamide-nucleotide amidase
MQRLLAGADTFATASMKMFGIPESTLAKSLREIGVDVDLDELEITTCLRRGAELEIDVRYRVEAEPQREQLFAGLRERHATHIYTEEGESIDGLVSELLRGHRIATGESCTAGKLAARLTDVPGSSDYFAGGVVAYSNEAKTNLLGVPAMLIAERGAVSPEVAEALADGTIERFDADIGVGITGVAGPGGGTEEKPVGYVCLCVKSADGRMLARDPKLPGRREDVRDRSVSVAMHMIRRLLRGEDAPF